MTQSALPTQCLCHYYFLPSTAFEKLQNPLELISEIKVESKKTKNTTKTPI